MTTSPPGRSPESTASLSTPTAPTTAGPSGMRRTRPGMRARLAASAIVAATALLALAACVPGAQAGALPTHAPNEVVPAPSGGTLSDQVPTPSPAATVDAKVGSKASIGGGVSIAISGLTATKVTAKTPGEVSGDAVVVRVTVDNRGAVPADVDSAFVDLVASDGTFGVATTAGDPKPFTGEVAPDSSATASYVFMMSKPHGRPVTVTVSHAAGAPVAQFQGTVS